MKKKNPVKGQVDFVLFSVILLLLAIGVIMVYSASSYISIYKEKDSMHYLKRQLVWAVLGITSMFVGMSIDYHKYKRYTVALLIVCIPMLIAVFFFPGVNGAQRWIYIGPAQLQPSEIVKYAIVFYLAKSLDFKGEKVKDFFYGVFPYLLVSGFYAGMILLEKNMSIASVIMIVTLIVLFVGGARAFHLFGIVTPALTALALFFIYSSDYRRARMLNFLNPWQDPAGNGYQLIQSLLALGSGKILGLGLGQSRQKAYYMPEPHNDFIFSIIGEELGLVGCIFIITLFLVFIWRGIKVALEAKDTYGTLLATGITSIIAVQAMVNIAVVTGSMPVTGVPLPFISYGGSSLLFNMIAMGVLLNISRQKANI